ncbi:MAG: helix-turn-helix transcriptional regulator, partial [Chloroflexi bacterium]|nr:helix-turn-helix transcriptional regulator [Chloroflexota bacterium]
SALAERARVSQAYIAKLERGDANPTIGHIGRLLACMGLKPSVSVAPMVAAASSESVDAGSRGDYKFKAVYSDGPLADVAGSSVEQASPAV